jgi:hypothetical protein
MISGQHDDVRFSRADYLAGGILFLFTLAVFSLSPVTQVSDSQYSLLLSDSLLRHKTFTLDHYGIPRHKPQVGIRDDYVANGPIWQLEIVNDHLYYYFPPGSSILSLPFVAVVKQLGFSVVNTDGIYNEQAEINLQKVLAAILMSLCVLVLYFTARYFLTLPWSVLISAAAGFGTQIWSTTSRALWSHTWETLLLSVAILLLARNEVGGKPLRPVLLATISAWLYFVRPSSSLVIAAIAVYLMLRRRHQLIPFLLTGLAWLALFITYSWMEFGSALPSYYKPSRLRLDLFPVAFAGNLISPSRGLLIYVPVVLFVVFILIRFWRHVAPRPLAILAISVIVVHVFLVSSFANRLGDWWAGASYGPRYLSELVPWFALLATLGVQAMIRADRNPGTLAISGSAVLLGVSLFINGRGALSEATWKWSQPINDKQMRALLWDWRHPQFMAGLQSPAPLVEVPVLEPGLKLTFSSRDVDKYLWYGWSSPEPKFRWTDGREAAIVFRIRTASDTTLLLNAAPFTVDQKLPQQHLAVLLNGEYLQTLDLVAGPPRKIELRLPAGRLKDSNVLTFQLQNAISPKALGLSDDSRMLGILVEWMQVQ